MKLRSTAALALSLGLVAALAPFSQAEPKHTEIVKNYTAAGGTTEAEYPNVFTQDQNGSEAVGGALAISDNGENRVRIVAEDVTGLPTAMRVFFLRNGKTNPKPRLFCSGETTRALKIKPGTGIQVFMVAGACEGNPSIPTRGTLTFTFTGP